VHTEKGKAIVFYGSIVKKEVQYAFIRRDGFGDDLFVHKNNITENWDEYKVGRRMLFNLAFSYKGPLAINTKLI
jgi:cold shock CspA family protein